VVIDISCWQEGIDWEAVVNAGVTGVIIRATYGKELDTSFVSHIQNAKAYGLDIGVYCYSLATDAKEAQKEANEVIYILNTYDVQTKLGIWYDIEEKKCLNSEDPTGMCSAFIAFCNSYGRQAGVYASLSTFTSGIVNVHALASYAPYWVAQYDARCEFADEFPDARLSGWQYSDQNYIGNTNVDMNEWYEGDMS